MKYKYDKDYTWITDENDNVICQLFNKFEEDFKNADTNGPKIVAALNAMESKPETAGRTLAGAAPTTEQRDEIICPTCKVPRLHIAYSKLENKYKCIYCNTTWAAN
jgi:hypothetical protein